MALRGQNEETAGLQHLLLLVGMFGFDLGPQCFGIGLGVRGHRLQHLHLDIAAKLNIGAAPGHIGGDGHRVQLARIRHDLRFLLVLARIQDVVLDALAWVSNWLSISDFSMEVVPTRIGWPFSWAFWIDSMIALNLSLASR